MVRYVQDTKGNSIGDWRRQDWGLFDWQSLGVSSDPDLALETLEGAERKTKREEV
jgi:hypothetical protein